MAPTAAMGSHSIPLRCMILLNSHTRFMRELVLSPCIVDAWLLLSTPSAFAQAASYWTLFKCWSVPYSVTLSLIIYSLVILFTVWRANLVPDPVLGIWDTIEQRSRQKSVLCLLRHFCSEERETINQTKNIRISDCDQCHEEKDTGWCNREGGWGWWLGGQEKHPLPLSHCLSLVLFYSLFSTAPVSFLVFSP